MSDAKAANAKEKKPKQKKLKIIKHNWLIIKKVWKYTPSSVLWMIFDGVIWGLNHAIGTFILKVVFDSLDNGDPFSKIAWILAGSGVFYIILYVFHQNFWNHFKNRLDQKLQLALHEEIFAKAASLDLSCFDDPQFYNDYIFAMEEITQRAVDIQNDASKLIFNRPIAMIATLSVLSTVDPFFALAIFASNAVAVAFNIWGNRIGFEHKKNKKPLSRKSEYIKRVYYLADHSKEIRISDVNESFEREIEDNLENIRKMDIKYGKKYFIAYGLSRAIRAVINSGVLLWMTYLLLVKQSIMLGGFAAAVTALWRLTWVMTDFLDRMIKFPEHSLYIERYLKFFEYEPKIISGAVPVPAFERLAVRGADFAYKDEKVLKNVNFEINRGEKIAIVGYNGAGKTTLIKLLMRLYDPTGGGIEWNGRDIREYNLTEYRSHIGAVFQDYKIFAATIAENVLGDQFDGSEESRERVVRALHMATFDSKLEELERDHRGIDTPLTREFDKKGTGLSGGEAQKVALARVFARPFELIIMDEPSSALDPVSEYNLNKSILKFAGDRTVIFISHRLSTTRMADRIYMFDSGVIAESGTHDELMAMGGKYAEMFNMQAEKYRAG